MQNFHKKINEGQSKQSQYYECTRSAPLSPEKYEKREEGRRGELQKKMKEEIKKKLHEHETKKAEKRESRKEGDNFGEDSFCRNLKPEFREF